MPNPRGPVTVNAQSMTEFVKFTKTNGKELWVEVGCACAVEERNNTTAHIYTADRRRHTVNGSAQDVMSALVV